MPMGQLMGRRYFLILITAVFSACSDGNEKKEPLQAAFDGANITGMDANGNRFNLYDLQNDYVLLFFKDPDCNVCNQEAPEVMEVYEEYKDKLDIQLIVVHIPDDRETFDQYTNKNPGLPYPYIIPDSDIYYFRDYGFNSAPSLFLLNRKKQVLGKRVSTAGSLENLLERAVNQ